MKSNISNQALLYRLRTPVFKDLEHKIPFLAELYKDDDMIIELLEDYYYSDQAFWDDEELDELFCNDYPIDEIYDTYLQYLINRCDCELLDDYLFTVLFSPEYLDIEVKEELIRSNCGQC